MRHSVVPAAKQHTLHLLEQVGARVGVVSVVGVVGGRGRGRQRGAVGVYDRVLAHGGRGVEDEVGRDAEVVRERALVALCVREEGLEDAAVRERPAAGAGVGAGIGGGLVQHVVHAHGVVPVRVLVVGRGEREALIALVAVSEGVAQPREPRGHAQLQAVGRRVEVAADDREPGVRAARGPEELRELEGLAGAVGGVGVSGAGSAKGVVVGDEVRGVDVHGPGGRLEAQQAHALVGDEVGLALVRWLECGRVWTTLRTVRTPLRTHLVQRVGPAAERERVVEGAGDGEPREREQPRAEGVGPEGHREAHARVEVVVEAEARGLRARDQQVALAHVPDLLQHHQVEGPAAQRRRDLGRALRALRRDRQSCGRGPLVCGRNADGMRTARGRTYPTRSG